MNIPRQRTIVFILVAGLLLVALSLVLIFVSPQIIQDQIIKNVQLNPNNGFAYSVWRDVPIPFYMSVYFFHIVNPEAILNGEKPILSQRGPYVYREHRPKSNITFHENYTVSYRSYRQFHFVPERSSGNESDELMLPNMLALGAAILAEKLPPLMKLTFNLAMKKFNQSAFFRRTVGEIMWGYEDELIAFLKQAFPNLLPFKDKFGLFADLNNTDTGLFTINTGIDDISKVQGIDTWNGRRKVNFWHSDQCNMINGTSGEMWPPFLTPSDTLKFYSPDACRSLELVYQTSAQCFGLPSFRYIAPKTMFANGTVYPPNQGFCPCRESGVLNVSTCRMNSQVFVSHPHFYNGDPALWEAVDGLHPNEKDHALFIDIHAMTGVPLNVSIKLQLNLFLKAAEGIKLTGKMRTLLLPLMWFDETGNIDGPILNNFYVFMALIPQLLQYIQYILLGLGLLLLSVAAILGFISWQQRAKYLGTKILSALPAKCGTEKVKEGPRIKAQAETRF
ncbi:scavenger receptor class B member 1-like isoform X2 [Hypanus sabinus]|uniref:scavenger receptor class B member 1-like isoform X2 n=1 Tax=Hypanus sabinus TaxID=79690 RepID=UPI0028C4DDB7|nr:scavenger receptor class B member 1-like isoform X2 [Hypanus sabinus]XP_059850508.1 scavenger receptor class B member 1-like isoform X2 [Hypanus sabinus]